MALGYEGIILLDNKQYLITDGTVDHARPEIASEGTYAAPTLSEAVNRVHTFDFDEITGGFNIDCNFDLIDVLFEEENGWIPNRDQSKEFLWYSNKENELEYGDAYWSRISLSTGPGNFLSASIDINLIPGITPEADKYNLPTRYLELGEDYIGQRFGFEIDGNRTSPISFAFPEYQLPIPYWQTYLTFEDENGDELPEEIQIQNWSLEMNNSVTRRMTCAAASGDDQHPGPTLIQIGLASVVLNVTFVTVVTPLNAGSRQYSVPEKFRNANINIKGPSTTRSINLGRMDASIDGDEYSEPLQQITDGLNISGIGAIQEMSYQANGYFTMPHIVGV